MSLSLYWVPVVVKQSNNLPYALKKVLERRGVGGSHGIGVDWVMTEHEIPYLEGLADAEIDGARDIIEAIQKHGTIRVYTS